ILTVANGFTVNGNMGNSNNPTWLQLQVANGDLNLNSGVAVYGLVTVPNGTVTINANSGLFGASASDRFTLNGNGLVQWAGQSPQPPTAVSQSITIAENTSTGITLTGSDPQGLSLTFSVVTSPAHGTLSGVAPNLSYLPASNYFGSDSFT